MKPMVTRPWSLLAFASVLFFLLSSRPARADEEEPPAAGEASGAAPEHAHPEEAAHPDEAAHPEEADHHPEEAETETPDAADQDDEDEGPPTAEEVADGKEFDAVFGDIPDAPDAAALEARPDDAELKPSMTVEQFRTVVRVAKKVVLAKMAAKIAKKSDARMATFSWIVFVVSLCGLLLLAMPLFLKKRFPGKGKLLFTYSALAAATFFVTVNLFGGVLFGLRTAQGALSNYTNPSIAIARGTFDTLDDNAEDYIVMGKELFAPTLEQMRSHPEEQPAVLLLENGTKIIKDAKVFLTVAKTFKKVDFVFSILPIVLTILTLILFVLAIKPTLLEIVQLPALVAAGNASASRQVIGNSMRRVRGELYATLCTVGVLAVLTLVSSIVLGQIMKPALDALLSYFSIAVQYLQFADGASSGTVFVTLFGVVMFLVLNLATLILSMSFFLGKSQKIFQQRFNGGTPIAAHRRFFAWGIPAVLLIQLFPLVFMYVARFGLDAINEHILAGVTDAGAVSWTRLLLAGPAFLVVAFAVAFWACRGIKALQFLATYKVKPGAPAVASTNDAVAVP